jgi:hypothetical protein
MKSSIHANYATSPLKAVLRSSVRADRREEFYDRWEASNSRASIWEYADEIAVCKFHCPLKHGMSARSTKGIALVALIDASS